MVTLELSYEPLIEFWTIPAKPEPDSRYQPISEHCGLTETNFTGIIKFSPLINIW